MRHLLTAGACALHLVAAPALAQVRTDPSSHVRTESADVRALIAEAVERSVTVRTLVERIEGSNVIVYVKSGLPPSPQLDGRIGWISAAGGMRFLLIELACPRVRDMQLATLAHELRHAVEIADAPWVVSVSTLAEYYRRIGIRVDSIAGRMSFETDAAQEVAARVRRELLAARPKLTNEE